METQSGILESEEKYVQENSLDCKLFIHSDAEQSKIAIIDAQNKIRLIQEKATEDFFKGKAGILNLRFSKTYLICMPENLSLIPLDLYEEDPESSVETSNLIAADSYTSVIDKQGCMASFLPHEDQKFWLSILQDAELIPSSKIMINYLTDLKVKYKTILGLNFYADSFEVVYLEQSLLQFYSQLPASTPDEFNFFLLTLFEKLTINPALVQFYLWGNISESDKNFERLTKYSKNITFASSNFLMGAIECV